MIVDDLLPSENAMHRIVNFKVEFDNKQKFISLLANFSRFQQRIAVEMPKHLEQCVVIDVADFLLVLHSLDFYKKDLIMRTIVFHFQV